MNVMAQRLFILAGGLVSADLVWWRLGHFQVSPVYAGSVALGLVLSAAGLFYEMRRGEPRLAAMLLCGAFLVIFSAGASVLNSFLLTVAGPNSDAFLDRVDRALGFDWYAAMLAVARHPLLGQLFFAAYNMVLPQIALLLVALATWGRIESVYRLSARLALGALITMAIWALAPAFGAMTLYVLPPGLHPMLSMTGEIGRAQIALLHNGPGLIVPDALHGSLIGFPSYHCALALLVSWHAWELKSLRWPLLLLNAVVIISTPSQGGHHLVDVLGAIPVTAFVLFMTRARKSAEVSAKACVMVNETPKLTLKPLFLQAFRIDAAQDAQSNAAAIKSKLSGLS
jgi:hypothetical protein